MAAAKGKRRTKTNYNTRRRDALGVQDFTAAKDPLASGPLPASDPPAGDAAEP